MCACANSNIFHCGRWRERGEEVLVHGRCLLVPHLAVSRSLFRAPLSSLVLSVVARFRSDCEPLGGRGFPRLYQQEHFCTG